MGTAESVWPEIETSEAIGADRACAVTLTFEGLASRATKETFHIE